MTQQREMPEFAPLTLQQWFRDRGGTRNPHGRKVVLFPDTFNNHFHTDVGVAAVEAIEAAGWQVVMPQGHVCCGRPLYDYGFLDLAERYLRRSLEQLREWYREGVPIVGMEPSCLAVFKDELVEAAAPRRRRQAAVAERLPLRRVLPRASSSSRHGSSGKALALGPLPPQGDRRDGPGAGAAASRWGSRSRRCRPAAAGSPARGASSRLTTTSRSQPASRASCRAVRELPLDELVVANGFSCKTQIEQGKTGRRALHVAQVMKMAREHGPQGVPGPRPERAYYEARPRPGSAIVPPVGRDGGSATAAAGACALASRRVGGGR